MKILRLRLAHPCAQAPALEDWLVALANKRGLRVVRLPQATLHSAPLTAELSDEELVVALCQVNCLDRPQILRLAAQRISRGGLNMRVLGQTAVRERAEPILAELARQALSVEPRHKTWLGIRDLFRGEASLREPLLHWTRLAEPIMMPGKPNAAGWRLVA